MRHILIALAAMVTFSVAAVTIPYENLRYRVNYHFGIINKTAGYGDVRVHSCGSRFYGTLAGHSIDWEGRIYSVADTLEAVMTAVPGSPLDSERVIRKAGWYTKPLVSEMRGNGFRRELPQNHRTISGQGTLSASPATMEAIEITADMLAMFYYFHQMPFDRIKAGQRFRIDISDPEGKGKFVDIRYEGKKEYSHHGKNKPVYEVVFEYSYDGRPSNYPVTCEVACDTRIPLLFSATLPIGHMQLILE